jgi:hypothetical protein
MKKLLILLVVCTAHMAMADVNWKADFVMGDPSIKSINALSFGPEGILFIGDSKNAMIYAIDTKDMVSSEEIEEINVDHFDQLVADQLGAKVSDITILDMAVNPASKHLYFAVQHSDGTPLLLKWQEGALMPVSLQNISYSSQMLDKAVAEDAQDRRGRSLRMWAISDLQYANGKVMVTGLSNQEFGSTFRSIPFPFKKNTDMASLEIFHAAHGRYETDSPIKTFTSTQLNGQEFIVAGYTCTPLVVFPETDLQSGKHVKGRTVAELGNWNTPLDMITMAKDGKNYLLLANSNRALMKIDLNEVANFSGSLTDPVEERSATAGVSFIALPFVNVQQLDKLTDDTFVMLQRKADGNLQLYTSSNRWL